MATFERFLLFNVRPLAVAAILCHRFLKAGRYVHLLVYAVNAIVAGGLSLFFFLLCLSATIVVGIHFGVSAPGLLITLVCLTGISVISMLYDVASLMGIWAVLLYKEIREVKDAIKDKSVLLAAADQIIKGLDGTPQGPGADTPPSAPPPASEQGPPATKV